MRLPVLLGGRPITDPVPLTEPTLPCFDQLGEEFRSVLTSRMLTNANWVKSLEERAASYLGVRHVVAVPSCSLGLILVLSCLELTGEVIVPSFTFCASGHAAVWNNLRPVFCECEPDTMNADPDHVESLITDNTAAIMGVHVFGNPCNLARLNEIASDRGLPLVIDAAHAFGSEYREQKVGGQATAHVFSLSPTKVLVAGEGGLIATDDGDLADKLKLARNYGHNGDYDCTFVGINGRMPEFNALLAIGGLRHLDFWLTKRLRTVELYRRCLSGVPGIGFQTVDARDRSTYKDFTITIDPDEFGLDCGQLAAYLKAEGIATRRYFYPPLHEQQVYRRLSDRHRSLPVTERVSRRVLTLPLYSHMKDETVEAIVDRIRAAHAWQDDIGRILIESRVSEGRSGVELSAAVSAL